MINYFLNEQSQFQIQDYQTGKPFASFLPGIAGPMGIPLWVFYVNRGQAIASFGVKSKDTPILEYQPANRAYQLASFLGFRTFIRMQRGNRTFFYEPFKPGTSTQEMVICPNELQLREVNSAKGLKTEVVYFTLPGENLAGLVRIVTITNLSGQPVELEILDGLPAIIPFGVNNQILKDIGRTIEAWMEVYNVEQNIPYYRFRASVADTAEVSGFEAGHFVLSFRNDTEGAARLPVIVDPLLVFGQNTSLSEPGTFYRSGLPGLLAQTQITCGRTPCGFSACQVELKPGHSTRINSLYGHASSLESIQSRVDTITNPGYLDKKRSEGNELVQTLTEVIDCRTGSRVFDAYSRQTFLDNVLRGGWPIAFGKGKQAPIFHIYSRKHGDLERDYNAFSIAPEYYSQGNGSYRDVNQNRREDVWFKPAVGDFNIRVFMSLIQADGYNPLVVQGSRFTVIPEKLAGLLSLIKDEDKLGDLLSKPFSPGSLVKEIIDHRIRLKVGRQVFLEKVILSSKQNILGVHGEGYWVDHWTYNLDLIETFLAIFPEQKQDLLFLRNDYPFYNSPVIVQPRSRKYVLVDGKPRQLNSLFEDPEKRSQIASAGEDQGWLRVAHGSGAIYRTTLFAKLFILALVKFATLDPWGMGIEMEAGRPGWDDAMNGLPGLFGSSMAETFALKRLVSFLREAIRPAETGQLHLPVEIIRFLHKVSSELKHFQTAEEDTRDYHYWDKVSLARETYRANIRIGLDGAEEELSFADLEENLKAFEIKIDSGIARALEMNNNLPPTYFTFRVDEFELLKNKNGCPEVDTQGRPCIRVSRFTAEPLPLFLEGMARALRIQDGTTAADLYRQVKESPLYDPKLKMYKLNASLVALPNDIGRARAFTPGWLENESIWLHMEYKYLLEVLRSGLYEEFFEDLKSALIPFNDPKVYGRSLLENSSFLVSSAHPDESLHGAGFVARLSGASAEFLSMWRLMMAGPQPFFVQDNQLCLTFKPILPAWLFTKENTVTFKFLGRTPVLYHNPGRRNTYDPQTTIGRLELGLQHGKTLRFTGSIIPAPYARQIRDGKIRQVDVYFEE